MNGRELAEQVGEHYDRLFAVAYSYTRPDVDAALDAVQETALRTLCLRSEIIVDAPLRYLMTSVKHATFDAIRRRKRRAECTLDADWYGETAPDPAEAMCAEDDAREATSMVGKILSLGTPAEQRSMDRWLSGTHTTALAERVHRSRLKAKARRMLVAA